MKKKTKNKIEKFFLGLAIFSVVVAFAEGIYFYDADEYSNLLIRGMLIIQNTIHAFTFRSDIGIKEVAKTLQDGVTGFEWLINWTYLFVLYIAPYCTLTYAYKFLRQIFHMRKKKQLDTNKGIIIFGYNEDVKNLLEEYSKKVEQKDENYLEYRIHLVTENISNEDELDLLKSGVIMHKIDCLKLSEEQLKYFFKQMKTNLADNIILFDESSVKNFSLYKMFHDEKEKMELKPDIKFFCRCENEGVHALLEDFHDEHSEYDMETISVSELRVRKTLKETNLHSYYLEKEEVPLKDWNLHLLIIGFGQLGQQMLLQAMNQGVVSSENKILVDIIDFNVEKKLSVFANHFSRDYVDITDNTLSISSAKADGMFLARFHQMDVSYKKCYDILKKYGSKENDGIYTYVAICIENEEIAIHSLTEVQKYLREVVGKEDKDNVKIVIRMEMDKYMKEYLNSNEKTFKNVSAIVECKDVITLEDLFHDQLDEDAKDYNRIYNRIDIVKACEVTEFESEQNVDAKMDARLLWRALPLFKRDSNRAVAEHAAIKEIVLQKLLQKENQTDLKKWFGENGCVLRSVGNAWVYEDEDKLVAQQSDTKTYPCVSEMSRLEHRRWCYFMASCGWSGMKDDTKEEKNVEEKKNVCLCTWDDLVKKNKKTCKYDLMWLLKK